MVTEIAWRVAGILSSQAALMSEIVWRVGWTEAGISFGLL